jgi:MFS family permease
MTGAFFLWLSVYTYPSFLSAYAKSTLNATPVMVGMIVGSYGLTQMLLRIPVGVISDVIRRRKPFLILGMAASLLSAVGLALVKTPAGALVFRGLAGVAVSTWVAHIALYSQMFDPEEANDAIGRISAMQYGAQVAAMLVGGFLAQLVAPEAAFLLGAAAAAAGLVVVSGVREQPIQTVTPRRTVLMVLRESLAVVRDKSLLISTLLATVYQFAAWARAGLYRVWPATGGPGASAWASCPPRSS